MDNKNIRIIDTVPEYCSNEEVRMSLDKQGQVVMLDTQDLIETLTGLIHVPGLISHYEQDIADELCQRGFFNLEEGSITAAGRDFLACHE